MCTTYSTAASRRNLTSQKNTVSASLREFRTERNQETSDDLNILNIWEFVYFVCGLSPPKRRVVRWRNFGHRRVTTMCRTCAGFYVCRGRRYENNDIFHKCVQVSLHFCSRELRSVGGTVGGRSIPVGWLNGCSSVGRCSDVAGVSQSDWPLRV